MRTKLIAGNWKMNTSLADAHILADGVRNQAEHYEHIEIVLCPPAIWLTELAHRIAPGQFSHLKLGAQNMHPEDQGTFTGEISPRMIKEVAEYVIIGHSERTHLFHEDRDFIEAKLRAALAHGLTPILCVGEDAQGSQDKVLQTLQYFVHDLPDGDKERLVVAYEPVWAISHGAAVPASPEYAGDMVKMLRTALPEATRILYGGSVNDENVAGFLQRPEIDGFLIGGASLKLASFLGVCRAANDLSIPSL